MKILTTDSKLIYFSVKIVTENKIVDITEMVRPHDNNLKYIERLGVWHDTQRDSKYYVDLINEASSHIQIILKIFE